MTKFSEWILNPGTAGPSIVEGMRRLGILRPQSTEAQARAGTDTTTDMSPLRVTQNLASQLPSAPFTASFAFSNPTSVREIFEREISPDLFGGPTGVDDTVSILRARDAAAERNASIVLPRGIYFLGETLELPSKTSLVLMPGATLKATPTFTGNSLVRLGDPGGSAFADDIYVGGGGSLDTSNVPNILFGIDVAYARFSRIENLKIAGSVSNSIRVGDPGAPAASYEIDMTRIRAWREDVPNSEGSHGFRWQNATDCYGSMLQAIGYRTGFLIEGSSIEIAQCHAWVRPVHGVMRRAFDVQGSGSTLVQCYADTPTNFGDPLIEDLVCFNLFGFSPTLVSCRAFINTNYPGSDISTDGIISVLHMEREVFGNVDNLVLSGATTEKRWRALLSGTYGTGTNINNVIDGGAVVYAETGTREQRHAAALTSTFYGPVALDGISTTNGIFTANASMRRRGPAGSNRDILIQTDDSLRWSLRGTNSAESGSNAGTDFHVVAYTDGGVFLRTQVLMDRRTGLTRFGGPVGGAGYVVSSLPDATLFNGATIFITDRSNRLAYSNGANWLWISDDTIVS